MRSVLSVLLFATVTQASAQSGGMLVSRPPDMDSAQVLSTARRVLAARGWTLEPDEAGVIDASKDNSAIRVFVSDRALRFNDRSARPRGTKQRDHRDHGPQLNAVPQEEIDALRADLVAVFERRVPVASLVQERPLIAKLPPGMKLEEVMQIARSALAARGWRITSNLLSTIEAQDGNSRMRLYVADGAMRYTDLAQSRREFRQRNEDPQPPLDAVPGERIAELRKDLIAAFGGDITRGEMARAPGMLLLGNLPTNLTDDQILRAVWSALASRRWIVKSGGGDSVSAEYASGDTDGKLKVFIIGQELRYSDEGTRSKHTRSFISVPDNWIANLRADTAKALSQLSTGQKVPAIRPAAAPSAAPRTAAERLRTLKELHDSGAITRDEYDTKRAEILKGL